MDLDEIYRRQDWKLFAKTFFDSYSQATDAEQLRLLRMLLCEYRDERAMQAVIDLNFL